jgi:hypothetical protein
VNDQKKNKFNSGSHSEQEIQASYSNFSFTLSQDKLGQKAILRGCFTKFLNSEIKNDWQGSRRSSLGL